MTEQQPYYQQHSWSNMGQYWPWLVWGIAALFYCYENFLQVSLNVIGPDLMKAFALSAGSLGGLFSYYFVTYAAMQIPVGLLLDRFGPRVILSMAAAVVGLGCLFFGLAPVFDFVVVGRLLIGFGSAFAIVSCFKLISLWFPLERFALLSGLTVTIGFSGSLIGEYPFALLVDAIGWRANMISFSVLGILIALCVWQLVTLPDTMQVNQQAADKMRLWNGLLTILRRGKSWLVAGYGSLMFAPTLILGPSWGGMFMSTAYRVPIDLAVATVSMIYVGWIIGAPTFGWYSDTTRRRKPSLIISTIGTFITLMPVLYINTMPLILAGALLFLAGFFSSGFLVSFSIIREINLSRVSGAAMGFMNTLNSMGGVIGPFLIGQLLDLTWDGKMLDGIRIYNIAEYQDALMLIPIILITALIMLPFIPETGCKAID